MQAVDVFKGRSLDVSDEHWQMMRELQDAAAAEVARAHEVYVACQGKGL
jgi:hypothetical protein